MALAFHLHCSFTENVRFVVYWLTRPPHARKVLGSSPGEYIVLFLFFLMFVCARSFTSLLHSIRRRLAHHRQCKERLGGESTDTKSSTK